MKRSCFALALLLVVLGCSAKEPVTGIWKGTVNVPEKYKNDPQAKAQLAAMGSPVLDLKDDKTFTLTMGLPMTGTWTEAETEITLKVEKVAGQDVSALPGGAAKQNLESIKALISEDRRKLSLQATQGMDGSVEFTR